MAGRVTTLPQIAALAREAGEWRVHAKGDWWAGTAVFLRLPKPASKPVEATLRAGHLEHAGTTHHADTLPTWLPQVEIVGLDRRRSVAAALGDPLVADARPWGLIGTARRVMVASGWYGVDERFIAFLRTHANPDTWRVAKIAHSGKGYGNRKPPMVLAYREGRLVGGCMPLVCRGSLMEKCP